jgi:uncharacterized protein (TIGR03086 family)
MTTTSTLPAADRYRELAEQFTRKVTSVPADRWGNPSPCEGWTALDVVRHIIDTQRQIVTVVGLDLPPGPSVDEDPAKAWTATRDAMQAVLDKPELGGREYDGLFGRTSLSATVSTFHCFDLIVHGWDLSRAAGLDEFIPEEQLTWVDDVAHQQGEMIRADGACGPAIQVGEDADNQTRVLAFLGRDAR